VEFRKDQILENEEKKRTCGGKQPLFLTLTGCLSILLIFALCAALLPEPSSLLAVNPTVEMTDEDRAAIQKKMDELNDLSKSIDDYEKRMKANSSQQKSVIGQLKNLQSNMNGIENDLASLKKDLAATEANIGGLEKDIEVKTGEVNQRSDYLNERLCQIYTEGDASYLDVLFASTSLTDFLTRYDLMGKIVENDMSMLAGLQADRQQLETEKASLEAAKAKLDRIKAQQEEKHQTLESQSTEKAGLLKTLESDKAEIQQRPWMNWKKHKRKSRNLWPASRLNINRFTWAAAPWAGLCRAEHPFPQVMATGSTPSRRNAVSIRASTSPRRKTRR